MNEVKLLLLLFGGVFSISCSNCCDDPCKDHGIEFARLFIDFSTADYANRKTTCGIPVPLGDLNGNTGQDSRTNNLDPNKYVLFVKIISGCSSFATDIDASNVVPAQDLQIDDLNAVTILLNRNTAGSEITIPIPSVLGTIQVVYSEPCNSCEFLASCNSYRPVFTSKTEVKVPKGTTSQGSAISVSMPMSHLDTPCNSNCK